MYNLYSSCRLLQLAALFILFTSQLHAAPKRYYDDQSATALREMRDSLDDLRHEVSNHEIEIKTYDEKVRNLENIIDSLRQQSTDTAQAHKSALYDSSTSLESKISSLEATTKGLVADLKKFQAHANETAATLSQYKQKMADFEKILDLQNQNIDNLHTALKSITDALQVKSNFSPVGGKTYRVVPGDNLEKIAKKNSTTIQIIKELNNLANDKIIVGQTLKMP